MYKILVALLPFIRELFFDKEEEMVFTSSKFNIKKWVVYFLFILGCAYALLVTNSLFSISSKFIDLNKRYRKLEALESNERTILNTTLEQNAQLQVENADIKNKCQKPNDEKPSTNNVNSGKVKKSDNRK